MSASEVSNLKFAIIGMGMGGLATALALAKKGFKNIAIYEYASSIAEVGAGIQLAPNMARILDRLDVWSDIEKHAVALEAMSIRVAFTNEEKALVNMTPVKSLYGYPAMVGHRSSLAQSLLKGCKREPAIEFHFSSPVETVHSFGPNPTFTIAPRDGKPYLVKCDVLLAADGIKSTVRDQMLQLQGMDSHVKDTGYAAYRILLRRDQMQHDPELLQLIDAPHVIRWVGKKRHVLSYPVDNLQIYNVVPVNPDDHFASAPSILYTTKGDKSEMMAMYDDFHPMIKRLLDLAPEGELCEWRLRVHDPLPCWTLHQTALIGDACHPTLPHLGQGAAQAVEDGAALAQIFSKLRPTNSETIRKALKVYEEVRRERADTLTALAALSAKVMHAEEGAEKEQREAQYAALKKHNKGEVPDRFADSDVQKMMYDVDIMKVVDEEFDAIFARQS